MRKNIILLLLAALLTICVGCGSGGNVKVYEDTEETVITHDEKTITAVVTDIDLEHNIVSFVECTDGRKSTLIYHGGVMVKDTYDKEIGISGLSPGMVVDVLYYEDTGKLVSIQISSSATVLKGINKLSVDLDEHKATYKGTSCVLSDYAVAFDGDCAVDILEINTEDQVTLYLYGGKLVSVVLELGHGYVRLLNQDTYIGGMVEIGYDVIVPVTDDMLLPVREGEYTLRINKNGYSDSKEVSVPRGKEVQVDLKDIAIPTGTATFSVTPAEASIYVSENKIEGNTYTNIYGSYNLKIEAEGYKSFNGSFKISEPVKSFTIELVKLADEDDDTTGEDSSTDDSSGTKTDTGTDTGTNSGSGSQTGTTTEAEQSTANVINVKTPVGVGVYFDGDYVGVAPVSIPKVPGTHTITLYQTGYLIKSYTIQAVDNGKDDEYSFAALSSLLDLIE